MGSGPDNLPKYIKDFTSDDVSKWMNFGDSHKRAADSFRKNNIDGFKLLMYNFTDLDDPILKKLHTIRCPARMMFVFQWECLLQDRMIWDSDNMKTNIISRLRDFKQTQIREGFELSDSRGSLYIPIDLIELVIEFTV